MSRARSSRLQELIHRREKVLAVLHPPSAAHARIMELAGCEALFVGTGGVVGVYTGLADVGTATMTECVTIAGWIADSVRVPVMVDGDTGHGGIMSLATADLPADPEALRAFALACQAELAAATTELKAAQLSVQLRTLEIEKLKFQIDKLRRMQFGRSSERIARRIGSWSCNSKNWRPARRKKRRRP